MCVPFPIKLNFANIFRYLGKGIPITGIPHVIMASGGMHRTRVVNRLNRLAILLPISGAIVAVKLLRNLITMKK
jgi:hypothetical protein